MDKKLIMNCDLLSFTKGKAEVFTGQDILIEGDRIQAIGNTGSLKVEPDVENIPADGLLAVPGFINTHAHTPMVLFRNLAEDVTPTVWFNDYVWPMESNLTEEDVYWGAQLGMAEMIENGVTCVADHYFYVDEIARSIEESGMRANLVWAVFGHEGEEKVDQTVEFIQRWQGKADGASPLIRPACALHNQPGIPDHVRQKADENNVGIHIHVSETNSG